MESSNEPTVAPVCFAVGIVVLLVGLVVAPLEVAPLGAVVAVLAGAFWVRGSGRVERRREPAPPTPEHLDTGERFPRSRLLERATIGIGGLVAAGVALPATAVAVLPSFLGRRQAAVDLGPIASFPEGQFVVATFLADPAAGEVTRRAAYVRNNGQVDGLPSFTIMSSRCTHVGCPTQPNGPVFSTKRRAVHTPGGEVGIVPAHPSGFGCPCHGSQFDTEGNRTAGPAARALDRYEFSIRDERLVLGRLFSVSHVDGTDARAVIHRFPLHDPGQPVTGPESWLYPISPS